MFEDNSRALYLTDEEGDMVHVEITEYYGMMTIAIGDKFRISISPEDAFDLVDALTMVANDVNSHTGEE